MSNKITIPDENITNKIYLSRGQKVMLDRDLAELFGVKTKRLKEQVRRNINRFPVSFMFELTSKEYEFLRSQFATFTRGRHSKYPPFVFTEHGVLMLSSVLNSEIAIRISIQIIETFIQLRKLVNNFEEIRSKLEQMESQYGEKFEEIYKIIQQLLKKPKSKPRKKIGYKK